MEVAEILVGTMYIHLYVLVVGLNVLQSMQLYI